MIESAEEAYLDEPVSKTNNSLRGTTIAEINAHNASHGGQIVLIRKLQNSWDSSKGVSLQIFG
jgi:hypothetical protein